MNRPLVRKLGFSLVELVIVVVIIGIIAAIATPRLSRGASAASESALRGNLKSLRSAIDRYAAEHGGAYPGYHKIDGQQKGDGNVEWLSFGVCRNSHRLKCSNTEVSRTQSQIDFPFSIRGIQNEHLVSFHWLVFGDSAVMEPSDKAGRPEGG